MGHMTRSAQASGPLYVPLDGSGHPATQVGGKGASLDRLVRGGFRVPASAALTSDAYRRFVRESGLDTWLVRFARRRPASPEKAQAERREVEAAFLEATLPVDLQDAIGAAWEYASSHGLVAVRSSATAEDLAATSFAGQYLSVLEVDGIDDVESAVKRVWASLWEPAARAYRRRMRIDGRKLAMGVVVQSMIPARRSGVCFTTDATRPATLRIETVDGLGEALVSGEATPVVLQLELPSLKPVDGELEPDLRKVARTALRIQEDMGGTPQDVEWSIADDGLWVLQARPITTLDLRPRDSEGDGFDTEAIPGALYSPTGVGEMLPGVLSPLIWTINGPMVEEGFRRLFARIGALPESLDRPFSVLGRFRGQAALNITAVKEAAVRLSPGSGDDVERQYLGRTASDEEKSPPKVTPVDRARSMSRRMRALKAQKRIEIDAETFEREAREVVRLRTDFSELLGGEILAYRARLRDLAASGVATQVAVATTAVTTYGSLETMVERWTGSGAEWAQRITRGAAISGDVLGDTMAAVWAEFADTPAATAIREAITEGEPGTIESRLEATGPAGARFAARLWDALDELGSSAVYAGPLWREQRGYVWSLAMRKLSGELDTETHTPANDVRATAQKDLAELEKSLGGGAKWRTQRVLTGQVVDVRKRLLRQMVTDSQRLLHRRETVKSALLALGGEERRALLELGTRLVRRGILDKVGDVELLSDWELEDVIGGRALDRAEIERRRAVLREYRGQPALSVLVNEKVADDVFAGDTLNGWAASPGRYRGRVRVVRDLVEAGELKPGEVLVAQATDPSWTPLFMIAGAIVVERGGPLSHAAIVSRELGVPAVLNAQGATSALHSGEMVEVDGSTGEIRIVLDDTSDERLEEPA